MAAPAVIAIALGAALLITMLIAVIAASVLVTVQVRREERHWTLTGPAPRAGALLARSVCGICIRGMGDRYGGQPVPEPEVAWYERSTGPSWR
jgi:hypothetical protein